MDNINFFIQNIHSKRNDRISCALIYRRISHEAAKGFGLHYEIYNYRFLDGLLNHLEYLNEKYADILYKVC